MNHNLISFFLILVLVSCKKDQPSVMAVPQVDVFEVAAEKVPIYTDFVGQVYGEKDIPIRTRVQGFVEKIHFQEGSSVKKGQILYDIDDKPFLEKVAVQQNLVSQAETVLAQSESDLQRIEPLAEMNAVSMRELDMARAQRDAGISALEAARANLNLSEIDLSYTHIRSPMDGIIGKTLAREGEFVGVSPNPVILNTVSNINSVRVQFFLSESQYLRIYKEMLEHKKLNEDVERYELELILADESIHNFKGKIDFIDRNIDPTTGTILVQASFPNPEGIIRPGQYTKVRARSDSKTEALLVPQKSVMEIQGQYFVYVVGTDGKIENRHIYVKVPFENFYIIEKGVGAGEKIIFRDLQKLRPGMQIVPNLVSKDSIINIPN